MSVFTNKVSSEMHSDRPLENKQIFKLIYLVKLLFFLEILHTTTNAVL